MIEMWDEDVPNLDVCGIMVRDKPECECPCEHCEGIIFEAWERMAYGGVKFGSDETRDIGDILAEIGFVGSGWRALRHGS